MASSSSSSPSTMATRRPYHGSCHCGLIRYIAYLTLPHPIPTSSLPPTKGTQRIYKCNCSTCQKISFFHIRVADAPNDFIVLSPLDVPGGGLKRGDGGLGDYTCFRGSIHWYFCSVCAVRCFAFAGEGEIRRVKADWVKDGEEVRGWMVKSEGWGTGKKVCYLSLNAGTLEPGQEGLDLREWTEKGWVSNLDCKEDVGGDRFGRPYPGGMY